MRRSALLSVWICDSQDSGMIKTNKRCGFAGRRNGKFKLSCFLKRGNSSFTCITGNVKALKEGQRHESISFERTTLIFTISQGFSRVALFSRPCKLCSPWTVGPSYTRWRRSFGTCATRRAAGCAAGLGIPSGYPKTYIPWIPVSSR